MPKMTDKQREKITIKKAKEKLKKQKQKEKEKQKQKEKELKEKIKHKTRKGEKRGLSTLKKSLAKIEQKRQAERAEKKALALSRKKQKELKEKTKGTLSPRKNGIEWIHKKKSENMGLQQKTYYVVMTVVYGDETIRSFIIRTNDYEKVKTVRRCKIEMYEQNGEENVEKYGEHVTLVYVTKAIAYDID
jgi:hypothetical protein